MFTLQIQVLGETEHMLVSRGGLVYEGSVDARRLA